eukprot:CAMPEP_0172519182 /NCGR_PEP_ID=MMETSP1066-20121228/291261_1 /TAXON_ID=671091 /ORGANISM="Coscinodiscus wailesii, Strain CCMP2513" /LENGTH=104 /DNA_ID=CAMNT_0013301717 /DNA_START=261 /DNA_END=575 /DNA_ORIENTATION=-
MIPIERYYAASDKVFSAFQESFEKGDLDGAYVFGKRFARFSTECLPTHDSYKSSDAYFKRLRRKNVDDVRAVLDGLEYITSLMDMEEMGKSSAGSTNAESRECS